MRHLKQSLALSGVFITLLAIGALVAQVEELPDPQAQHDLSTRWFPVEVSRVVDGDTVDVVADLGFDVYTTQRIRLAAINAPELRDPGGQEAKNWLAMLLRRGKPLRLYAEKRGRWGRYIGTFKSGDVDLNQKMIEDGHAKPYGK